MNTTRIAYLIVAVGFIAAAFYASLDPEVVNWSIFLPAIVVGFVGVVMLKRAQSAEARDETRLAAGRETLRRSLDRLLLDLQDLSHRAESLPVEELPGEIDRLLRTDLAAFVEARQTMVQTIGLQGYAQVMSAFAAGERYINRVWSSATDGYRDEALDYLKRAHAQIRQAEELYLSLQPASAQA